VADINISYYCWKFSAKVTVTSLKAAMADILVAQAVLQGDGLWKADRQMLSALK
jgi:hypothetical protein